MASTPETTKATAGQILPSWRLLDPCGDAGIAGSYDVTELLAELGFSPTCGDPDFPEWLDRYLAVCPEDGGGWFAVTTPDPEGELNLFVLTDNGVCRSQAQFDMTEIGHRMFAGAVEALR